MGPPQGPTLVSLVTPSLNQGRFLPVAIASIAAQSHPAIEHIVVDGGSTDATLGILHNAASTGSLRWVSEPDAGMYDALNKGLRMATGEILGYLNCDDVLTPWAVETAVRAFALHPEADVVFGDGLTIDEASGRQRLSLIPPFDSRAYASAGSLVQPAVFWRRRAHERLGGFDADLRFVGDLDYWLRLGASATFVRVDEVLAIERQHAGALSQASADRMGAEAAQMRRRHQQALGTTSRFATLLARSRAALWRRLLWLRFLGSLRRRGVVGERPWGRFISEGNVRVSPLRIVAMFIPRLGAPFAWDAVVSDRAWFRQDLPATGNA